MHLEIRGAMDNEKLTDSAANYDIANAVCLSCLFTGLRVTEIVQLSLGPFIGTSRKLEAFRRRRMRARAGARVPMKGPKLNCTISDI